MIDIATRIETALDSALSSYVTSVSQTMSAYLVPIATAGTTVYLLFMSYAIIRGDNEAPVSKLVKDFVSLGLIGAVALAAGNYQYWVIDFANILQSDLVKVVTSSAPGGAVSIGAAIDNIFSATNCIVPPGESECVPLDIVLYQMAQKKVNFLGIPDLYYVIASVFLWIAEIVIIACCLLPWLPAKAALAIWLALGPAAIVCLMWPATKAYFQQWLSAMLGAVFTMAIVAAIVTVIPSMYRNLVQEVIAGGLSDGTDVLGRAIAMCIAALGLGIVAVNASQKGAHLAGGGVALDGRGLANFVINQVQQSRLRNSYPGSADAGAAGALPNKALGGGPVAEKAAHQAGYAVGKGAAAIQSVLSAINRKGAP